MKSLSKSKQIESQTPNARASTQAVVMSTVLSRRIYTLHEIVLRFEFAASREQILTIVGQKARLLLGFDICLVGILNRASTHFELYSLSQSPELAEIHHQLFDARGGIFGRVLSNQLPIVEELGETRPDGNIIEQRLHRVKMKTLLIVPMRTSNETIGFIAFCSSKHNTFVEEDIGIAQLFALYVATSLKTIMLLEDTQKRMMQIELINSITHKLTTILQRDELVRAAAEIIQKSFNYYDVTIFTFSEDRTELILEAHSGSFIDFQPKEYKQALSQGIIGWVASNGEKILTNDTTQEPRYLAFGLHNTRSELALPIKIENQVVGVLNVEDIKLYAFDDTDAVVLETLCEQLGSVMKNAQLYDEVQKMNIKLTEMDQMKSEFLGIVSHDFRNPLSNIILSGRFLLRNENVQSNQRIKEQVQLMVDQATRLNTLAEDTLSIARIESGQMNYYFKIVNMESLVQEAISFVRHSPRHNLSQQVELHATFIKADQSKIRQVIQNLISNAVKYSPKGGNVIVTVADHSPEEILVSVKDEGLGIPPDQYDKLFKKFSRVQEESSQKIKGTGLGLWICKAIVEAHGGKIWFETEVGKGTTFKLTLKKTQ